MRIIDEQGNPQPVPSYMRPPTRMGVWYEPWTWATDITNSVTQDAVTVADAALTEAFKVAAGIIALKLAYDYLKKKKTSRKKG